MWTISDASEIIKPFEPIAVIMGYHVALGGSVMYKGESEKDLDIIVYPHQTEDMLRPKPASLMDLFRYNKLIKSYGNIPWSERFPNFDNKRTVFGAMINDGRKIDFLFV